MALYPLGLCPWIELRFLDSDGNPLSSGKVQTYLAGTSTPKATYEDANGVTQNPVEIELDLNGRPPDPIFLANDAGYKFIVLDADDVPQYTIDNIENVGAVFAENFGQVLTEGSKDVTSGYTVLETDRLVTVDSTGGADPCVIQLPAAADYTQLLTIKNMGTVDLAITPNGGDTIDSLAAVYTLDASASPVFSTVQLISDGASSWWVVSKFIP